MLKRVFEKKITAIIICMILGAIVRMAFCLEYPVQPRDSYKYEISVREWIMDGDIKSVSRRYPLVLWVFKTIHSHIKYDIMKEAIITNVLISEIIIALSILLAAQFSNKSIVYYAAGLLTATHPSLIQYSCFVLRENFYLVFTLLFFLFAIRFYKCRTIKFLVYSGVAGAISFLCRLEGLETLIFFFMFSFYQIIQRKAKVLYIVRNCICFVAVYALTVYLLCCLMSYKIMSLDYLSTRLISD